MKFLLTRLARLRLYTLLFAHRISKRVRGASLARLVRSRRFLIAAYMLAVIALAGAWWWDSPERFLGQRPPFTPPDRTAPPLVTPPTADPATQPLTEDPVVELPQEAEPKPPETPTPAAQPTTPAVPAMATPVTIDALHRPVAGEIVKQYGFRWSATHQDFRYHLGLGIAAAPGSVVVAAYAGRVKSIETNHPEWGTLVVVEHGGGWRTEYASLTAPAVRVGQAVTAGQKLGQLGANPPARSADPAQLYFALFKDDASHDPAPKLR